MINSTKENKKKISKTEAHIIIKSALNKRLQNDRTLTNKKKYGNKALPEKLILEMWKNILLRDENLPENWLKASGVLVGIPNLPDQCEPHTHKA
jgi:hypothetical protein